MKIETFTLGPLQTNAYLITVTEPAAAEGEKPKERAIVIDQA